MRPTINALLTLCLTMGAPSTHSEPSKFSTEDLAVVPANHVLGDGSQRTFKVGKELQFLTARTFDVANRPISMRLFSLYGGESVPKGVRVFDPCEVYSSVLSQVFFNASGIIKFFTLPPSWLHAREDGQVEPRRFLAIFEEGDGNGDRLIRLHNDHKSSYFANGVVIVVEPERIYSLQEAKSMAAAQKVRSTETHSAASVNEARLTCYKIKINKKADASDPLQVSGVEDIAYALSDDCDLDVPTP